MSQNQLDLSFSDSIFTSSYRFIESIVVLAIAVFYPDSKLELRLKVIANTTIKQLQHWNHKGSRYIALKDDGYLSKNLP